MYVHSSWRRLSTCCFWKLFSNFGCLDHMRSVASSHISFKLLQTTACIRLHERVLWHKSYSVDEKFGRMEAKETDYVDGSVLLKRDSSLVVQRQVQLDIRHYVQWCFQAIWITLFLLVAADSYCQGLALRLSKMVAASRWTGYIISSFHLQKRYVFKKF